ncbi:hypothetical protein [Lactobacillus porci]|uniref:hypothetical protein n=1 Tax=Lactobacillus porci TaxID=2012477 RepID=UPI003993E93E
MKNKAKSTRLVKKLSITKISLISNEVRLIFSAKLMHKTDAQITLMHMLEQNKTRQIIDLTGFSVD